MAAREAGKARKKMGIVKRILCFLLALVLLVILGRVDAIDKRKRKQ